MRLIAGLCRNDIPLSPKGAKLGIRGQQLIYLLVLLATNSTEWLEVTKVLDLIWYQPDLRMVFAGASSTTRSVKRN